MNKAELETDLQSRVISVIETVEQEDVKKQAAGIKTYRANVFKLDNSGRASAQNIIYYVVGEGTPQEAAFYEDPDRAGAQNQLRAETLAYIETLNFVKVQIEDVNNTNEFVVAKVWEEDASGDLEEKRIMLYKDGDTPVHKVIK